MKTKCSWKVIPGAVVLLLLTSTVDYFFAESMAIAWHLRHGYHAQMNGLKFRVPLFYEEDHDSNMLQLSFSTTPGHLNRKMASILVDFHRYPLVVPDPKREERLTQLGIKELSPHPLRMAGHDGTCIHRVPLNEKSTAPMAQALKGTYVVDCSFSDDLHVSFWGTPNAVPDFYAMMQSAESVRVVQ